MIRLLRQKCQPGAQTYNFVIILNQVTKPLKYETPQSPASYLIFVLLPIGSLYPFLLAIPLNSALAINYATMEVPMFSKKSSFNEALQFWQRKVRYFKGQFISIAIFQMFLFAFVADRQFRLAHTELDVQFVKEER